MKKCFFLKLIMSLLFGASFLNAVAPVNQWLSFNASGQLPGLMYKPNNYSLTQYRSTKLFKEVIAETKNGRVLDFDGRFVVLVSNELIKVFKLDKNLEIIEQFQTTDFNYLAISAASILGSKKIIAFANEESDVFLFDISSGNFKLIDSFLGNGQLANFITFSSDGSKLAVLNYMTDTISLFNINNNVLTKAATIFTEVESGPFTAIFSEDGTNLAILCKKQNSVKLFSFVENDWKLRNSIELKDNQSGYFFSGDTLILGDQELCMSHSMAKMNPNESSVELSPQENVPLVITTKSKTLTRTSRPLIKGKTIPNQKVQIYINDTLWDEVLSNKSGDFSFRVKNSLPNGLYKFNAQIQLEHKKISSNFVNFKINKYYPLKLMQRRRGK